MLEVLGSIPSEIILSFSGGKNSMAILDYISRYNIKVKLLYVDFGEKKRLEYVKNIVNRYKIDKKVYLDLDIQTPTRRRGSEEYEEAFKINQLNEICFKYNPKLVISCISLEDVVINYLFNCFNGEPRIMKYRSRNVIRPFMRNDTSTLEHWIENKKIGYYESEPKKIPSTQDFIKKHVLHNAYKINPDLNTVILNQISKEFAEFLNNRTKK